LTRINEYYTIAEKKVKTIHIGGEKLLGKTILVTSGKGGTGKTTVAAGLSSCLAALGRRVVCIDADVGLRNMDLTLGMSDQVVLDFQDVLIGTASMREALYQHPKIPGLYFMAAPADIQASHVVPEHFSEMTQALQKFCDYCFIDCAAGLSAGFALAVGSCDHAIVVSALEPSALRDATRISELLEQREMKETWLTLNRLRPELIAEEVLNVDDAMDMVGLPLLGLIPEDSAVIDAGNKGIPLALYGDTSANRALLNMAKRLEGEKVPFSEKYFRAQYRLRKTVKTRKRTGGRT